MRADKAKKFADKRASGAAGPKGPRVGLNVLDDIRTTPYGIADGRKHMTTIKGEGTRMTQYDNTPLKSLYGKFAKHYSVDRVALQRLLNAKHEGGARPNYYEDGPSKKKSSGSHQMPDGSIMAGASHRSAGAAGMDGPRSPRIDRMANLESVRREAARRQAPDGMFMPRWSEDSRADDLTSGWIYGADPVRPGLLGQPYADSEKMNAWVNRRPQGDVYDERWSTPEDFTWRIAEARRRYAAEQEYLGIPQPRPIYNTDYWSSNDGY